MIKYSVLMSVYSKENPDYLKEAVDSMLHQTIQPNEIVIVKDGTLTSELDDVLDSFKNTEPGIFNIIGYDTNQGLGYALNFGLRHCKNEIIARMDSDDISVNNRCEKQLDQFENNLELDIASGRIDEFIEEKGNVIASRIVPLTHEDVIKYMKTRCPLNHMAVMLKKSSVQNAGGYKDCFWNEDYYLWIRMALNHAVFSNLNDTLVLVRIGSDMYKRRGGIKYFKSELFLQKLMLHNGMISFYTFISNVIKRLIVQLVLPSGIRGIVFKLFARQ